MPENRKLNSMKYKRAKFHSIQQRLEIERNLSPFILFPFFPFLSSLDCRVTNNKFILDYRRSNDFPSAKKRNETINNNKLRLNRMYTCGDQVFSRMKIREISFINEMMTRYCNQAKQAYYLNLLYQRSTYNKLHRNVNKILNYHAHSFRNIFYFSQTPVIYM